MRRLAYAPLIALACACTSSTDGPTPKIDNVQPNPVCVAQKVMTLSITGSGFSPRVDDALTSTPKVVMPAVGIGDYSVPPEDVRELDPSGTSLTAAIPIGAVSPGTYDVTVANPDGHADTFSGLVVDPPPTVTAVMPTTGLTGTMVGITLTGTGFLPTMTVTLESMPPIACTGVMVMGGTSATCMLDLNGVAAGTYSITVDNGDGCSATLANGFTVVSEEFTLLGIDPPFGYMGDATTNVTISAGGNFVSTPTAYMTPHGATTPQYPLKRIAFVDASTITALVPTGTMPLGKYDLTVVNPPSAGTFGTLANAFEVVAMPIPAIDDVVPSRAPPSTSTNLTIYGKNFRSPVTVLLLDRTGATAATASAATVSNGGTQIAATITTPSIQDAYLVRVIDTDEMTYSTWSAFIVGAEGASGNLHTFSTSANLTTGRRMLGGASARDDLGNAFVYAIAGDDGTNVLSSVEVAQLSKFGALGAWHQEKTSNDLTTTRDAPIAATVELAQGTDPCTGSGILCLPPAKTYVYVVGGRASGGTVLNSVERAMVLRNADAPVVADPTAATGGTLAEGTWYYKVSAICSSTDLDNKNGETLPSDEAIITLAAPNNAVSLSWTAVATAECTAVGYKVYRTAAANGASQQELLIATPGNVLSYTDTGASAGTEVPLPPGALGVWTAETITLATTGRWGHQGAVIADGNNSGGAAGHSLYVLGGKSDATTGYLDTVQYAGIDSNGHLVGTTFATSSTTVLPTPMAFFSLVVETAQNVSGYTGSTPRLITAGGVTGGSGNGATNELQQSTIASGGGNGAWSAVFTNATLLNAVGGDMAVIASNKLWAVGGARMYSNTNQSFSNVTANGDDVSFSAGDLVSPTNSAANTLPAARALGVPITGSGFIYFVGGTSNGTDATNTTYQTF